MSATIKDNPFDPYLVKADRNRWFYLSIVLVVIIGYLVYDNLRIRDRVVDKDVYWVRIYPDSTWDVTVNDLPEHPSYFVATIDSLLSNFAVKRYSLIPETIRSDYGIALLFLSPVMGNQFVSAEGFAASTVAAKTIDCGEACLPHHVDVRTVNHYESIDPIQSDTDRYYRSQIFLDEYDIDRYGKKRNVEKTILDVTWHVLEKRDLLARYGQATNRKELKEYLVMNPISLEITKYEKYRDPSQLTSEAGETVDGEGTQ